MRWIRDPVKRLLISLVTAALIALSFGHGMDVQPLMGFWGILYPEYCFSSVEKAGDGWRPGSHSGGCELLRLVIE